MKHKSLWAKFRLRLVDTWPLILLGLLLGIFSIGLLTFQLNSLVPGYAPIELQHQQIVAEQSIGGQRTLLQYPLYLPFQIGLYVLQILNLDAIRMVSVVIGLISIAAVFSIVKRWHTMRVSILITILYASSASLLHTARLADETSSLLLIPVIFALGLYFKDIRSPAIRLAFLIIGAILFLYIPGLIWVAICLALLYRKKTLERIKSVTPINAVIYGTAGLILVSLLLIAFVINPSLITEWLGVRSDDTTTIYSFIGNIVQAVQNLFIWSSLPVSRWVGNAPIVDTFVTVCFLLGCYYYVLLRKLERVKVLTAVLLGLLIVAGLGGPFMSFAIVPFVYIIAAAGMSLLLQQWFTVFPKNPIARYFAISVVVICVGATSLYNVHRYFVVWPRTPAVQREFSSLAE